MEDEIDFAKGMAVPDDIGTLAREWRNIERPGYFGRRRDLMHAQYDLQYGVGNWRLAWVVNGYGADSTDISFSFEQACELFYEESYYRHLESRPADIDFICEFTECIDNAPTNVHSGLDYTAQEAYSTHIQDIAVRNVLSRLGRVFTGKRAELLVIRSADSNGFRFGPGNIPLYQPKLITKLSLCPAWANKGSVEDFWQSNKWLQAAR